MNKHELEFVGSAVYWEPKNSNRDVIYRGLKALNLEEYTPPTRTLMAAMKSALESAKDDNMIVVDSKVHKQGYELVEVSPGALSNYYKKVLDVWFDKNTPNMVGPYSGKGDIWRKYSDQKAIVTGTSVGSSLVKIAAHFAGESLRKAGGIYFIREKHMGKWRDVEKVYELAGTSMNQLRVKQDKHTAKAIGEAVTKRIVAKCQGYMDAIHDPDTDKRYIEKLVDQARLLKAEAEWCVNEFGSNMDNATEAADRAANAATAATIARFRS